MAFYLDSSKKKIIIRIVLIVILVALIATPIFVYSGIKKGASEALREGKNIRLAFSTLDIEFYSKNKNVYDVTMPGNMGAEVESWIRGLYPNLGQFEITDYDWDTRKVTGMKYYTDDYLVLYKYDENGDHWSVDYMFNVIAAKDKKE